MLNLIPKEEKRKIVKVFYMKLVILFLVVGGFSLLFATVSILPAYFLSNAKKNIANIKLATQKAEPVPVPEAETVALIKDTNKKIKLVEFSEQNKFLVSEKIINTILSKKLPNIKITDISYKNEPLKGKIISIQGVAPSREVLLSFRKSFEDDKSFKQVDLPISNFVKGSDIQFYLSLMPF